MDKSSFLAWLQGREGRYELVGGRVLMMTGSTMAHGLIAGSMALAIGHPEYPSATPDTR